MDLTVRTDAIGADDQSWMGSRHGTNNARTITLARAAFTAATHYPQGFMKSGTPLARYTTGANTGLYGPYTTGATDGSQNLAGFLLTPVSFVTWGSTGNVVAPLLEHGVVYLAKLPLTVDAAGQSSAPARIWFR